MNSGNSAEAPLTPMNGVSRYLGRREVPRGTKFCGNNIGTSLKLRYSSSESEQLDLRHYGRNARLKSFVLIVGRNLGMIGLRKLGGDKTRRYLGRFEEEEIYLFRLPRFQLCFGRCSFTWNIDRIKLQST